MNESPLLSFGALLLLAIAIILVVLVALDEPAVIGSFRCLFIDRAAPGCAFLIGA